MCRKVITKINSKCGESLIEVLAGIIIIALSSSVFLSMTLASTKINMKSKAADEKFYEAVSILEAEPQKASEKETKVSVDVVREVNGEVKETYSVNVNVFKESGLCAYEASETE